MERKTVCCEESFPASLQQKIETFDDTKWLAVVGKCFLRRNVQPSCRGTSGPIYVSGGDSAKIQAIK